MANEKQQVNFTNADEKLRLAFKKANGSLSAEFSPASTNTEIKAAAEGLYGGTITVTGTRTSTGSTPDRLFSGPAYLVFGGSLANTDVELVQVTQGEQRSISATDTVTFNGVDITPGDAVSDIQTAVRTSGVTGDSGVNVSGDSTAGSNGSTSSLLEGANVTGTVDGGVLSELVDGNTASGGITVYSGEFLIDRGSQAYMDSIKIFHDGAAFPDGTFITVSGSDTGDFGGEETVFVAGVNVKLQANPYVRTFARAQYRYIKVSAGDGNQTLAVYEVQAFDSEAVDTPGSLNLSLNYAPSAGNVATPSSSGGTVTTNVQGGSTPSSISVTVLADGAPLLNTKLNYNYITESGSSSVLDLASVIPDFAGSAVGWTAGLQIADSRDETATFDGVLKHSDTGVFDGEESEVCTFDTVSARGAQHISSDTATDELKQYLRLDYTIAGGTDPGFAIGLAAGPGRATLDDD